MIFTSGAVEELSGELLVGGEVLWEAFSPPGWHSGELFVHSGQLFGAPGSPGIGLDCKREHDFHFWGR